MAEYLVVPGFFGNVYVGCHWAGYESLYSFHIEMTEDDAYFVAKSKKVCGGDGATGQVEMVTSETR